MTGMHQQVDPLSPTKALLSAKGKRLFGAQAIQPRSFKAIDFFRGRLFALRKSRQTDISLFDFVAPLCLFCLNSEHISFVIFITSACLNFPIATSPIMGIRSKVLANWAQFVHKPDQGELQLDRSQLPNPEHLGLIRQEAAQPNITKRLTTTRKGQDQRGTLWEVQSRTTRSKHDKTTMKLKKD